MFWLRAWLGSYAKRRLTIILVASGILLAVGTILAVILVLAILDGVVG